MQNEAIQNEPPDRLVRRIGCNAAGNGIEPLLDREWLVTNGLGGYASGTISGVCTRRYHGLLIAAMPAPLGRIVMLTGVTEELRFPDNSTAELGGEERAHGIFHTPGLRWLCEFRLEMGLPVWRYEFGSHVVEKRILMPHMQNTVYISYALISGAGPVRLRLRPSMHFRRQDEEVSDNLEKPYLIRAEGNHFEITSEKAFRPLRFFLYGVEGSFNLTGGAFRKTFYRIEARRGYTRSGNLWSPGAFRAMLDAENDVTLVASMESWGVIHALKPDEAYKAEIARRGRIIAAAFPEKRSEVGAELVLAADQFVISPITRIMDAALARAAGSEPRSIIAGYHWFTDWGRDTMISLEGLTLTTGRFTEASYILRTFAQYVRDGLIPNLFPEGETEGLYHTSDATLWFFHAVDRYIRISGDRETLSVLLPVLRDIVERHIAGTRFGIGVDPEDGLLHQGREGYALTWMDAKAGDWVVTPRRGKAVEINALWYNALRVHAGWLREAGEKEAAARISDLADKAREAFNRRFWFEEGEYLYDVVDGENGDDSALRPNQLFAVSLPYPVLDPVRWKTVLEAVEERLLTPYGLRTLGRDHPDYKLEYGGDLLSRDAAYHQGTVWPWLIGPFIDARLKVYPEDRDGARRCLLGLITHLEDACVGSIGEVFDAEPPFRPEGCISQAWSVAEVLRCWIKTAI